MKMLGTSAAALIVLWSAGCAEPPLQDDAATVDQRELWEVHYLNGSKTGYSVSRAEPVVADARRLVRTTKHIVQSILRFGEMTTQELEYESLETGGGELVACRWLLKSGSSVTTSTLTARGDYLDVVLESTGNRQVSRLEWQPNGRGYFAVEQSLRNQPMEPGEQRIFQTLLPFFNQLVTTRLVAEPWETTSLLAGEARLMPVTCTQHIASSDETVTLWVDDGGEIQKTESVDLGQVSYRTEREVALREEKTGAKFDLGLASSIAVKGLDDNPHETQRARYRIRMQRGDPSQIFAESAQQAVRKIDAHTAEVIVDASGDLAARKTDDLPMNQHLDASHWIQANDPEIEQLAAKLAGSNEGTWEMAVAAEALVHQYVRRRNFEQGMATAADVVRSAEGDCTEYAVLLAAICRAHKIPVRVAVGVVYSPGSHAFAFHMWNEVWVTDRWLALDATLGRGGIGGGHLKITDSALADTASLADLLPVLRVLGDLEIELLAVD